LPRPGLLLRLLLPPDEQHWLGAARLVKVPKESIEEFGCIGVKRREDGVACCVVFVVLLKTRW